MKKYFSKIFSIYILFITLIPCADVCSTNACLMEDKLHIEQSSTQDEHCDDMCSPLCVCLCCNDVTTAGDKFIFEHFQIQSVFNQTQTQNFLHNFSESDSPPPKS